MVPAATLIPRRHDHSGASRIRGGMTLFHGTGSVFARRTTSGGILIASEYFREDKSPIVGFRRPPGNLA